MYLYITHSTNTGDIKGLLLCMQHIMQVCRHAQEWIVCGHIYVQLCEYVKIYTHTQSHQLMCTVLKSASGSLCVRACTCERRLSEWLNPQAFKEQWHKRLHITGFKATWNIAKTFFKQNVRCIAIYTIPLHAHTCKTHAHTQNTHTHMQNTRATSGIELTCLSEPWHGGREPGQAVGELAGLHNSGKGFGMAGRDDVRNCCSSSCSLLERQRKRECGSWGWRAKGRVWRIKRE